MRIASPKQQGHSHSDRKQCGTYENFPAIDIRVHNGHSPARKHPGRVISAARMNFECVG
jgi:hypothetical protein